VCLVLKFRVRADIILDDESEAMGIFASLKGERDRFVTIRKGEPDEERSRVSIEKCYHDEDPTKPCEIIEIIESE